jgi:molybdenum cofactor cytidylyltransferase
MPSIHEDSHHQYGIILLAAGASVRLGKAKQLLPYKGSNLLNYALKHALHAKASQVVLILGAEASLVAKNVEQENVYIVQNREWEEGISSSIRTGLNALLKLLPTVSYAIFMVCDQPFITFSHLDELIKTQYKSGKPIVASGYENAVGTPALFHKTYFPELLELKGDKGAKKIIEKYSNDVAVVPFIKGNIDIDTATDYKWLQEIKQE